MFEIMRRNPGAMPIHDLMTFLTNDPFFRGSGEAYDSDAEGNLPLDIVEQPDALVVRASLPGFDKKDVEVQIEKGILAIKAHRETVSETNDEKYYRRERRIGSVSRRIALPGVLSETKAEASLENGELTVRIPKAEMAKPRQISVS